MKIALNKRGWGRDGYTQVLPFKPMLQSFLVLLHFDRVILLIRNDAIFHGGL